jgi:small conductance mechanosensitive channel
MGGVLARLLNRYKLEPPVRALLVRTAEVLVIGLFAILALENLGVELLPLIAGLGVAGAGIALAMQGVLGNMAAGLTIIFAPPFRVGDYISIAKEEGEVLDISLFSTTLGHADRSKVVIPNRKIVGEILHNYGRIRQLDVVIGVAYGTDMNLALNAIEEILRSNPRVLQDPAPAIGVVRLGDSRIDININPWVTLPDYSAAVSEVNKSILATFPARNIAMPLPQLEVRMLAGAA